jgi:hypothetical protein
MRLVQRDECGRAQCARRSSRGDAVSVDVSAADRDRPGDSQYGAAVPGPAFRGHPEEEKAGRCRLMSCEPGAGSEGTEPVSESAHCLYVAGVAGVVFDFGA